MAVSTLRRTSTRLRPRLERSQFFAQRRATLERTAERLGLPRGDLNSWYTVQRVDLLPSELSNSEPLWQQLAQGYPEHTWDVTRFELGSASASASAFLSRHRPPLERCAALLGLPLPPASASYPPSSNAILTSPSPSSHPLSAWYSVSVRSLLSVHVPVPLRLFAYSLPRTLATLFPEHSWDLTLFQSPSSTSSPLLAPSPSPSPSPSPFRFESLDSQRVFLESLGSRLGIPTLSPKDAWYKVRTAQVLSQGGATLLTKYYGGSVSAMLQGVFPEHPWDLSKFQTKPQHYWHSREHQIETLAELGPKLNLDPKGELAAWYKVSAEDFVRVGGRGLLKAFGDSLPAMLSIIYPEHTWDVHMFSKTSYRTR